MSQFYQIPVGSTIALGAPLNTDGIVFFHSSALNLNPGTNYTRLSLLGSDSSVILVIDFRHAQDAVVFNSRATGGSWLTEQRISLTSAFEGEGVNTTIAILDHGDRYQVLINGQTKIYYNKQLQGDVTSLAYEVAGGDTSVFSPTMAAQTYKNFAALVPGLA